MSRCKLILFRLFNITLGRCRYFSWMVKRFAVRELIKSRAPQDRYTASSRYFDFSEMKTSVENK